MSTQIAETQENRTITDVNAGPGDQTISLLLQPGSAFLDYYARNGSTTLNVLFSPNGQASATIQVDFGPKQPLLPGLKKFTFSQALQIVVNNQSGMVKYGWIAS
ncbi:MAG TPA: hypothetical protein VFK06_09375 [Candidatus Angelobacter sp.]|nr:hypothetical protein [Candidatus Angelobacter sp.]